MKEKADMGKYVLSKFPHVTVYGDDLDLDIIEDGLSFICNMKEYAYEEVVVEIIFANSFELTSGGYNKHYVPTKNPNGEYIPISEQTEIAAQDTIDRIIINKSKFFTLPFRFLIAVMVHELNHYIDWKEAEQIYEKTGVDFRVEPEISDQNCCRNYFLFHAFSESNSKYYEELYIWDDIKGDYYNRIRDSLPSKIDLRENDQDYLLNLMYVVGMIECVKHQEGNYKKEEIDSFVSEIKSEYKEIEEYNMEKAFDLNNVLRLCGLL